MTESYVNLEEIRMTVRKLDQEGDGKISKKEMAAAGLSEQEGVLAGLVP